MAELDIAVQLAQEAGKKIMEHYGDALGDYAKPREKDDASMVTQADLDSATIIMNGLKDAFPRHAILNEENEETIKDQKRLQNQHVWVIDPLDGTKDFAEKTGDFSIMIAYTVDRRPMVAVVYAPVHDKLYTAELSSGAYLTQNGAKEKLTVSANRLEQAVIALSRKEFTPEEAENIAKQIGMQNFLQAGSMGIKAGLIAEGLADLYINNDPRAGEWDSCAPGLILTEAGGKITDYDGKPIEYNKEQPYLPRGAVCSNTTIHDQIIPIVEQIAPLKKRK